MPAVNSDIIWDDFITSQKEPHILQTSAWAEFKKHFGWDSERVIHDGCGAQILFRKLPFGFSIAYIPKGPLGKLNTSFWQEILKICRKKHAIHLIVEPDGWESNGEQEGLILPTGFNQKQHSIQPRRTLLIDLTGDEEIILSAMKQKTRYNIRLAERKGIYVCVSDNIQTFYEMMQVTGARDGFAVHSNLYYQKVFDIFSQKNMCVLLEARYKNTPVASLMCFAFAKRAWYFYGASTNEERNRMPTYLLQWEAMRWAKEKGCKSYDLWGVPDADEDVLESEFINRSDGLWGVYRFKRGFGGELKRSHPTYEFVFRPWMHRIINYLSDRNLKQS